MIKTLMEPVIDAYSRFAKSVLDPVVEKLIKFPWIMRLLILLTLASGAILIQYRTPIFSHTRWMWLLANHSLNHPDRAPSLQQSDLAALEAMRERLVLYLQSEIFKLKDPDWRPDPWAIAQISVALGDELPEPDLAVRYLESSSTTDLGWGQPQGDPISHLGASGWSMFALGKLDRSLKKEQYEFFLASQNREGWWPQFAFGKEARENASIYATVWQLIGLNEHLKRSLVDQDLREGVGAAIDRGYAWLQLQGEGPNSFQRWNDYPFADEGAIAPDERALLRESVTGLVLHCLHILKPQLTSNSLKGFDSRWLQGLPPILPVPSSSGRSDYWLIVGDSRKQDTTRHYRLPWILVGIVDAYPSGSRSEHVTVNGRLEALFQDGHRYVDDVKQYNWLAAEFLYALNKVRQSSIQVTD